jgi:hypothetical protein
LRKIELPRSLGWEQETHLLDLSFIRCEALSLRAERQKEPNLESVVPKDGSFGAVSLDG